MESAGIAVVNYHLTTNPRAGNARKTQPSRGAWQLGRGNLTPFPLDLRSCLTSRLESTLGYSIAKNLKGSVAFHTIKSLGFYPYIALELLLLRGVTS